MKFLPWLIILLLLGYGFWGMQRTPQRTNSAREKALAIRGIALLVLFGIVFVAALIFLPNKGRVLMTLPAFFILVSVGKAWRNSRERLRREEENRVELEKMKRIN